MLDINECKDRTLNQCGNSSICENTEGSYICHEQRKRKSQLKLAILGMFFFFFFEIYIYINALGMPYKFGKMHKAVHDI